LNYFFTLGFFSTGTFPPRLEAVKMALLKLIAIPSSSAQIHSFILEPWTLSRQDNFHSDCFL